MKRIICANTKKELSKLINKLGINSQKYFQEKIFNSKYNITYEELISILQEDENIIINKGKKENETLISVKKIFFSKKEYLQNEEELYNWNYIKTLFREELNLNILHVYKLIKDLGEINYAEIRNLLKKLMDIKLDIKQISHYCKEIKLMNLIKNETNETSNEKIVSLRKIEYENVLNNLVFEAYDNNDNNNENYNNNNNHYDISNNTNFNFNSFPKEYKDFIFFDSDEEMSVNKNEGKKEIKIYKAIYIKINKYINTNK
jgi:hypothetical protein